MDNNYPAFLKIKSLLPLSESERRKIVDSLEPFENEIKAIIDKAKFANNLNDCIQEFTLLEEYQLIAAKLLFKYNFAMSDKLKTFINDFDRLDDLEARQYLLGGIKGGKYF